MKNVSRSKTMAVSGYVKGRQSGMTVRPTVKTPEVSYEGYTLDEVLHQIKIDTAINGWPAAVVVALKKSARNYFEKVNNKVE